MDTGPIVERVAANICPGLGESAGRTPALSIRGWALGAHAHAHAEVGVIVENADVEENKNELENKN